MANTIFVIDSSGDESRSVASAVATEADDVQVFESLEEFLFSIMPDACGCVLASSGLTRSGVCALIEGIHAHELDLPVVVLGRGDDVAAAVAFMRAGAVEYVELPVPSRHLRRVVRQALALHRTGATAGPEGTS